MCWVVYDEALDRRVVLLFSFDCLDCWCEELGSMNVGGVGSTFKYSKSFMVKLKDIGRLRVLFVY